MLAPFRSSQSVGHLNEFCVNASFDISLSVSVVFFSSLFCVRLMPNDAHHHLLFGCVLFLKLAVFHPIALSVRRAT